MLIARSSTSVQNARLLHGICIGRALTSLFVERAGLVFDTRFVPGAAESNGAMACLYIVLEGVWQAEGREPFVGPTAFLLSEAQLEGSSGVRPFTFRAWGDPFVAVELRISTKYFLAKLGAEPTPIALADSVWAAVRVATKKMHEKDDAPGRESVVDLVRALAETGVVRRTLVEQVLLRSPGFERLWEAVRPIAERFYLNPSLQELSAESGVSTRQLTRDLTGFVGTIGLVKTGWRAATKRLRLKLAVLFLSAEGVSVTETARIVGYGSSDAMARAFRDAALPSPSDVQASLRLLHPTASTRIRAY